MCYNIFNSINLWGLTMRLEKLRVFLTFYVLFIVVCGIGNNILIKENISPLFDKIGRDQGLLNLSVSNIIQDRYGFLWFGTQGGLVRYDGKEMKTFRTDPFIENGLAHNLIQTMYYDSENHELWIGTYQGVSRYFIHEDRFENYTVENANLSNSIIVAIEKRGANAWLGTLNGLNKLDLSTNEIVNFSIPGKVIRDLHFDTKGRLLVGTYEGLYEFDTENEILNKIDINLPSSYVMVIKEFEKNILTLGLWDGGIVKYNTDNGEITNKTFEDNRIYALYETTDETLWVGTWGGGLFAIDKNGKEYHFSGANEDDDISHPVVYALFQDKSGILWIGTNGNGISKLNPRKSNYLFISNDKGEKIHVPSGKVNSILKDSKGYLWIVVYNSGINRFDEKNNEMISYTTNISDENYIPCGSIVKVYETKNKELLLASGNGILKYNYDNNVFESLNIFPPGTIVYAIEETRNGDLWIGTYSEGAFKYNRNTGSLIQYKYIEHEESELTDNLVYDILVDSKDRVWIGTNNGLNMLKPGAKNFTFFKEIKGDKNQIAVNTVQSLFEDSRGNIWIGTNGGGVAIYNEDGTFTNLSESNGLSSNFVNGFVEGKFGEIWVSTNNGISIVEPDTFEITILTPDDGIGAWEFGAARFQDSEGNIYFGSTNGVTKIPGTFKNRDLPTPEIYITNIELFQKPIEIGYSFFNDMEMTFDAKENTLSFKFSALDFDSPEKTKYIHYLKGFDKDWVNGGERDYITYSNLPFGEYEFMVYAKTIRGIESDVANFKFIIERPWYRKYTAYLLYILSFLLIVYIIFKIWEAKMINEKNTQLVGMNDKLELANKKLEDLSITDALTGVYNRRYFDSLIEEYLSLSRRGNDYISLIMMDIDDFKDINDTYGHLAGDYVLKDISESINTILKRSTDYVSRYGGDEFVILLYDTNEKDTLTIAEKIKEIVTEIKVREGFTTDNVGITVSIGVYSVIPNANTTKDEIIRKADNALYISKKNGKNRINVYK